MVKAIGSRSLRELARVICNRRTVCLLIVVLLAAGTWATCATVGKHYRSSVKFQMREPLTRDYPDRDFYLDSSLRIFVNNQLELMASVPVLARAVLLMEYAESGDPLYQRWHEIRGELEDGRFNAYGMSEQRRADFEAVLVELDQRIEQRQSDPSHGAEFRERVRRFARNVKVEVGKVGKDVLTGSVTLIVTQPEPVERARIAADMVARSYLDRHRQLQWPGDQRPVAPTDARTMELRKARLEVARAAMDAFVARLDDPSDLEVLEQLTRNGPEADKHCLIRSQRENVLALDGELAELRLLQQQLLEQVPLVLWGVLPRTDSEGLLTVPALAVLNRMADTDPLLTGMVTTVPEKTMAGNLTIRQLKTTEATLLTDLNRLRVDYHDDHDEVRKKRAEIATTRRLILKEIVGEARTLRIPIATLSARRDEARVELQRLREQLNRLTGKLFEYQSLVHEMNLAQTQYCQASNDSTADTAGREQDTDGIAILVIEHAQLPDVSRPAYPKPFFYAVIASCVGLLLAVVYAFVADHFDHTFKSIEDAERYLGVPVVGSVPKCGGRLVT
ncbi:MAG: hypothetical protein GXY44_07125 [Phycisphaerales bacterium]|nr:hypothetical protein [Phycisphaerales bacterium]